MEKLGVSPRKRIAIARRIPRLDSAKLGMGFGVTSQAIPLWDGGARTGEVP